MVWCDVTQEGLCYQICCDLLSSLDGKIMGQKRRTEIDEKGQVQPIDPQFVDFYLTNNDLTFAYLWHEPRFGPGAFKIALQTMFKELYRYDLDYIMYGKPEPIAFEFAERMIK